MEGFVKFFGTGGARFVAATQMRATGGLWLNHRETNLFIDPGPGAVVHIHASGEHFDPEQLDGIVLTHRHLDHANDINILIEAMTRGGFQRKGVLFCPRDAISVEPVVLKHAREFVEKVEILKEKKTYRVKDITFETPVRHIHGVETYGLVFHVGKTIGLISDTKFFDALPDIYHADYLIVNVLRSEPIKPSHPLDHLSLENFVAIITKVKPEMAIMTHFGLGMIQGKPDILAEEVTKETGIKVVAAHDGMKLEF